MNRTRTAAGALAVCALVVGAAFTVGATGGGNRRPATNCAADRARIGDILGMRVSLGGDRLALLTTPPSDQLGVELRRDHIVTLALSVACCRGWGFSLDLHRNGARAFTASDLRDPEALSLRLGSDASPLAAYLRGRAKPEALVRRERVRDRTRELVRLAGLLADALNAAREDPMLYSDARFPAATVSKEARALLEAGAREARTRLRLHRLLLEDAFPAELSQDVDRYEIAYKPAELEAPLRSILGSSLVEKVLLATDSSFKAMSFGGGLPGDLALGPTEVYLCSAELEESARAGGGRGGPGSGYGRSRTWFELSAPWDVAYEEDSVTLLFRESRLVALAAGGTPEAEAAACTQDFISALNANLPALMTHRSALGDDFRLLKALLQIQRALLWAYVKQGIDLDFERLRSVPTEKVVNTPPKIRELATLFVDRNGRVAGQVTTGGIEFRGDVQLPGGIGLNDAPQLTSPAQPSSQPRCFSVERTRVQGRDVLEIDLSGILGLR